MNNEEEYEYYNIPKKTKLPRLINEQNINNNRNNINIRKKIMNKKNITPYDYNDNYNNYQYKIKNETVPSYFSNKYKNKIIIERPIEYNIKKEKENIDSFYTNNNDKLYLSYDIGRKEYLNGSLDNEYISPVIAKIAKHNYLMKNPYTDKKENLGPSMLRNNPILYPISTYKFDFKRYINNYHVNKFE